MHSRRSFLKTAAATAAAASAGSFTPRVFARTDDKSGKGPLVLGSGDYRYECVHDWLTPPSGLLWGDTHGVAQDESGRIYIAHTVHADSAKPDAVVVFGSDGTFSTAWGADFRGGAHGLDIRKEGSQEFLYHCDIRRRMVVKTDLDGKAAWQAEYPKESGFYESADKYCPTNVAFHPGGDFFVGDGYGSHYVHRYTSDGKFAKTVIKPGSEKGFVREPHGLWVDSRSGTPRLAVADRGNRRIQYFTLEGEHQGFVTEGMRKPCHMKTRGDVMLVPDLESVVTLLDKDNKVIAQLGDGNPSSLRGQPREKFIAGKFIHPHSAMFLKNGDILVVEWVPIGRVTLLRKV
jgi:hypothetical protein